MKQENIDRAERAETAINHYAENCLHQKSGEQSTEENIIDLITDLLHLCQKERIKIMPVLRMARMNYNDESGKAI